MVDSLHMHYVPTPPRKNKARVIPGGWVDNQLRNHYTGLDAEGNQKLVDDQNALYAQQRDAQAKGQHMTPEEEAASRVLMQVLAFCVVRLGGKVTIPRTVLESVTFQIAQATDEQGRIIITATENTDDNGNFEGGTDDLPW